MTRPPQYQSSVIDLCSEDEELRPRKRQRRSRDVTNAVQATSPSKQRNSPKQKNNDSNARDILLHLPFDILIEIFAFLSPLDLLHLSRTCKILRSTLLDESHSFFWRGSRKNVNKLPECPQDMSEPTYARLMFDLSCYICLKSSVPENLISSWPLRMRICSSCYRNKDYFGHVYDMTWAGQKIEKELFDAMTPVHLYGQLYYIPSILEGVTVYQKFGSDESAERTAWLQKQRDRQARDKKFTEDCSCWDQQWRLNVQEELNDRRRRRKEAIIRKLTDEGFGEEFKYFNERQEREFQHHPSVVPPEPLDEKAWVRMKKPLIKLMNDIRLARLAKERKAAVRGRLDILRVALEKYQSKRPQDEIIPPISDIAISADYISIINRPSKSNVDASHFEQLFSSLPLFAAEWLSNVDGKLIELMNQAMDSVKGDWPQPVLGKASIFFRCLSCKDMAPYPAILSHNCEASYKHWLEECDHPLELMTIFIYLHCAPQLELIEDHLSFYAPMFKRMHFILQECGLDTETTTEARLDAMDPLLECTHPLCTLEMGTGYRHAMRWRRAALHSLDIDKPSWKLMSSGDAKKLAPLEFGTHASAGKDDRCPFACSFCDYGPAGAQEMRAHMDICHQVPGTDARSWDYHSSASFEARAREIIWFKSRKQSQ